MIGKEGADENEGREIKMGIHFIYVFKICGNYWLLNLESFSLFVKIRKILLIKRHKTPKIVEA